MALRLQLDSVTTVLSYQVTAVCHIKASDRRLGQFCRRLGEVLLRVTRSTQRWPEEAAKGLLWLQPLQPAIIQFCEPRVGDATKAFGGVT